ncbi:MAG TPA: hypothetical protein VKB05_10275 [Pyrinomonadaceae bacterium]|nr:hypothetical protein [Pyrinomonadaceae bacterium]
MRERQALFDTPQELAKFIPTPKALAKFSSLTPKAFANFSPRLERERQPWVQEKIGINPERVRRLANAFSVDLCLLVNPWLSLRSNHGLKLANAFGVILAIQSTPWRLQLRQADAE